MVSAIKKRYRHEQMPVDNAVDVHSGDVVPVEPVEIAGTDEQATVTELQEARFCAASGGAARRIISR